MKKIIWTIVVLTLTLTMFPLASQAAPLKKLSWRAEYYDNPSLSGQPIISRFEAALSHDWGNGSPAQDLPKDFFSARYTITRHFERGTYLFILTVDDGARVWFDGKIILDAWDLGYKEKLEAKLYIGDTGDHELQVAYFENTGRATINLEWIQLGGKDDIVGAWRGEYFINKNLEGEPALVRQDGAINFDWNSGSPSPKITRDNFSVRWTRSIYLKEGSYNFRIQHDDGMRIFVDDKNIYDSWFDQPVGYRTRRVHLAQGYRTFRVEYYDHVGNAVAQVKIDGDPGDYGGYEPDSDGVSTVDNKSSGFQWGGPVATRHTVQGGYASDYYWTYNTNNAPINFGKWTPTLRGAGNYELFAFVPEANATSGKARYQVYHHGERVDRVLNQNDYSNEWASLGTYYFNGDGNEFVYLYDNTYESKASTKIAFDALKFVKQ